MIIKDMFDVGEIMEWEDKAKSIKPLTADDCEVIGKQLNKNKIILWMKRASDDSEGKVFVRLKDQVSKNFSVSRKLLGSKTIIGLTLNQFMNFKIEEL
jgi:hypothetical protein